jgi:hypothetical protein
VSELFERHRARLEKAIDACEKRYAWTAFTESPSSKVHGKDIPAAARVAFDELLDKPFDIDMPLGITYPQVDVDTLFEAAKIAQASWSLQPTEERVGLCLEILERLAKPEALFLNAHACARPWARSAGLCLQGDEGCSRDGRLAAPFRRHGGDSPREKVSFDAARHLDRDYLCHVSAMERISGHTCEPLDGPKTTLPVALFVRTMREVLAEYGYDPNLVTMVADTRDQPITIELLYHPDTAIIDFTGGPQFGQWIEKNCANALVYTETAGCNSVVIESTDDFSGMCDAIAHSLCQASAQMCTSVQNIFVPEGGIETDIGHVSFDEVCDGLVTSVDKLIAEPRKAAFLCGTLVDKNIYKTIEAVAAAAKGGQVLRESTPYVHPEFENARTATPLMLKVAADDKELYGKEHFGPISFVIVSDDAAHALQRATEDVRDHGAITSHVYSTNEQFLERAEHAYHMAGASLACNLIGMPINFAAAYSDFHVTGLNPAGNACLSDLAFVTSRFRISRFRIVQTKFPAAAMSG